MYPPLFNCDLMQLIRNVGICAGTPALWLNGTHRSENKLLRFASAFFQRVYNSIALVDEQLRFELALSSQAVFEPAWSARFVGQSQLIVSFDSVKDLDRVSRQSFVQILSRIRRRA